MAERPPSFARTPAKQPVKATAVMPAPGPSRFLTEDERIHIADRLQEDAGIREIAAELGRAPSTVSREIRRNAHPESGSYRPQAAQRRAGARRARRSGVGEGRRRSRRGV